MRMTKVKFFRGSFRTAEAAQKVFFCYFLFEKKVSRPGKARKVFKMAII